jgi:hypothetical protein
MVTTVTVAGVITDPLFHRSAAIANQLQQLYPEKIKANCLMFFETQWTLYLKQTANKLKGVFYDHSEQSTLVFTNESEYIGDADRFA